MGMGLAKFGGVGLVRFDYAQAFSAKLHSHPPELPSSPGMPDALISLCRI